MYSTRQAAPSSAVFFAHKADDGVSRDSGAFAAQAVTGPRQNKIDCSLLSVAGGSDNGPLPFTYPVHGLRGFRRPACDSRRNLGTDDKNLCSVEDWCKHFGDGYFWPLCCFALEREHRVRPTTKVCGGRRAAPNRAGGSISRIRAIRSSAPGTPTTPA